MASDAAFTCLQFESQSSVQSCIDTLREKRESGQHLQNVRLRYQGGWFGAEQVEPLVERRLYEELGAHPLVELRIYYSAYLLSSESLAETVQQTATSLKSLRLCSVILQEDENWRLRTALQQHKTLEQVEFTRVAFEGGRSLEPLVRVLSTCPKLQKLHLDALGTEETDARRYKYAFQDLLSLSPSLEEFSLRRFPRLEDASIAAMFQALKSNTTLQQFSVVSFARHTRLEKSGVQAASEMLRVNTALRGLQISVGHTPLQPLVDALQLNRTLKSLKIYVGTREPVAKEVSQSFLDMLETNYSLEELELYTIPCHDARIKFLLKLNVAGRGRLIENNTATAKDWVDSIVKHSQDESVVFYLMSKNPSLCQLARTTNNERKSRPRKRAKT